MSRKSHRPVSRLLQELRAEGQFVSSGHFSVDFKRALQKRAGYELASFELAVLKFVQAGVAVGATELALTESSTEMVFSAHRANWTRNQVFESLYRPGRNDKNGAHHLGQALRYWLKAFKSGVLVEFPEPPAYFWRGETFEEIETGLPPFEGLRLSLVGENGGAGFSSTPGALGHLLFDQCHSCPIPLFLDGKRINGFNNDPHSGYLPELRLPFTQKFWSADDEYLTAFRLCAGVDRSLLRLSELSGWSDSEVFPRDCSMASFLTANLRCSPQPSFLLWTRDGVIIKREELPPLGCIGITMILCGDELSVDLSGLKLIEGQLFELQKRNALVMAKQALIQLAESGEKLEIEDNKDSLLERARSFLGMRKKPGSELNAIELEVLQQHLIHLCAEYWSP